MHQQCATQVWDSKIKAPGGFLGDWRQCKKWAQDYREFEGHEYPVCGQHLRPGIDFFPVVRVRAYPPALAIEAERAAAREELPDA